MTHKETWLLKIDLNGKIGIGECGLLRGLSIDDRPDYEAKLQWVCENIEKGEEWLWDQLIEFPSLQFGVEMAFRSLGSTEPFLLFRPNLRQHKNRFPSTAWSGWEHPILCGNN
jgi:hypothetical protein